ncbi:mevalonate kinase [Flagellimonas meridianipacifica]|uniref:Galactokinase n=1 Tax=Flagellimonas meridianipacifica TaxID=1080225 RepID=A0A2T0M6G6_9FLAO|nr:GHMP kinase [Allomuricauda pacifica]PRX53089.1 galactokinase [Allomuricauda pacifica]
MINIRVPARICFYGDHQDYLGLPVIAGTIDRYINISATLNHTDRFEIQLKDIGTRRTINFNDSLEEVDEGDYFLSAIAVLKKSGLHLKHGYTVEIEGNIPLNAGLSSSSALTVAWIRFLLSSQEFPKTWTNKQVGHWAYEAEVLFFNQPGGLMDQYSIAQGGLIFIDTQKGETTKLSTKLGKLVVSESGLPKKTLDVLKNGRVYGQKAIKAVKQQYPDFNMKLASADDYEKYKHAVPEKYRAHWYAAVHNYQITKKAKKELLRENPDIKFLGGLMNAHQDILQNQIQNTPQPMIKMMEAAREAGALGTKIVGSGGGGCMVALVVEENMERVVQAFLSQGAKDAYEVNLTSS